MGGGGGGRRGEVGDKGEMEKIINELSTSSTFHLVTADVLFLFNL